MQTKNELKKKIKIIFYILFLIPIYIQMKQNPKIHKCKLRNPKGKEHRQIIKQVNYKGKHIYNNQKLKQKNQDKNI